MKFKDFYDWLLTQTINKWRLKVFGDNLKIIWMASYKTISGLEYTKIVFKNKSFLYVVPEEEELYYSAKYITETHIPYEDIGNKETIEYNGKKYKLENKDDYQYVTKLHIWDITTIEWECRFSDYMPNEWNDFLSLGWVTYTNKRADINPTLININDIEII